jgi:hypothetical protein
MKPTPRAPEHDEPPPVLGTWLRLYAAIIVWLAFLIAVFHLFTRTWNR